MQIRSPEDAARRYARGSAQAFLDGEKNLNWITGVLASSGVGKPETALLLAPFRNYGKPGRAQELFGWLEGASW